MTWVPWPDRTALLANPIIGWLRRERDFVLHADLLGLKPEEEINIFCYGSAITVQNMNKSKNPVDDAMRVCNTLLMAAQSLAMSNGLAINMAGPPATSSGGP